MAEDNEGTPSTDALQRHVATLVLGEIGSVGFALAGSSAIREHGITDRPTNDVDLFTTAATGPEAFTAAVAAGEQILSQRGYRVTRTRTTAEFARLLVETIEGATPGLVVEVDFGIDWRHDPPTQLAIGPVLGVRDAVGSKIAAVYSRGEARDFLDLDAIRESGRFNDSELLSLAADHDPGFERREFVRQLLRVHDLGVVETTEYGVDADHLDRIKARLTTWADELAVPELPASSPPAISPSPPRMTQHRPPPPAPPGTEQTRDGSGPSIGR